METKKGLMKHFRIKEFTDDGMTFDAPDNVPFLNDLKNTIKYGVPSLAVDKVIIVENNTTYSSGFLAQRLMLVPIISTNMQQYKMIGEYPEEVSPDQDGSTGSILYLDMQNNGQTQSREPIWITTNDLTPQRPGDPVPIGDPITIMPLKLGQRIKLRAIVRKGIGKLNSRYSPVSISIFGPNTGSD